MIPELDLSSPGIAFASVALVGFLVALFPVGLAEVAAIAIGAVRPPGLALGLLSVFTLAHVAGKAPWYALGLLGDRVKQPRARLWLLRAREFLAQRPAYGVGLLAVSAFASVPPYHLASIAAGIVRLPFGRFLLVCLAGRAARFGLLASIPVLLRG